MIGEVHHEATTRIVDCPELSTLVRNDKATLSQTTLYVDDGVILASGPTLDTTAKIITIAFKETHKWLAHRGLKTDQVKNELMHFMKTKNQVTNPSICIPANTPDTLKEVTSTNCMRYLGLWFDPQLSFQEHAKIPASTPSTTAQPLPILANPPT